MMGSGDLKHRITFLKPSNVINENGFETEGFIVFKTVWASASNLAGKEYFAAAAVQKEKTLKFKMRAISDIDESMRIVFQGKPYNITSINNIKYENKYVEVKALEVEEHG